MFYLHFVAFCMAECCMELWQDYCIKHLIVVNADADVNFVSCKSKVTLFKIKIDTDLLGVIYTVAGLDIMQHQRAIGRVFRRLVSQQVRHSRWDGKMKMVNI